MRGNMFLRSVLALSAAVAILGLAAGSAQAQAVVIFSEDFESPVVSGFSKGTLPDNGYWVGSSAGSGSDRKGLINEDGGDFTDPVGEQAFAFRYTNSGLTTADAVIGDFMSGITYTISFDAVLDGYNDTTPYTLQLIAFADGAARNDCRSTPAGSTMLQQVTGNATEDGLYTHVTFDYTVEPGAAEVGMDIGLRFRGATSSAIIDNVLVTMPGGAYWDLNGSDPGSGGSTPSGVWNATNAYFNPLDDGTGTPIAWTPGGKATFSAGDDANGTYTITVDGTQDIGGLTFLNGDVTLTPGAAGVLRMTSDTTVNVDAGLTTTIATQITDDGTAWELTKAGTGTLVISGSGTLGSGGNLTVSGGAIDMGGTSQTVGAMSISAAAPSGDTVSNGTITATSYAASNDTGTAIVSANLLDDAGSTMTKSGTGAMVLSGSNTYTGMTSINAGALVFGKQAALNGGLSSFTPANITVESGAALGLGVGDSGAGYFDSAAVGTVLSQMGTSTATTGMKAGAQLGLDTTNATGGTFTQSSVIGDLSDGNSLGLAKLGEGQLILDADNTYTGATTVYAGTLTAGAGKTSAFGATASLAFGPGSAATVQLNGNEISVSSLTSNGGTPIMENGADTDSALTINHSADITYAGVLQDGAGSGTLGLVKDGASMLTLSGTNTYTGGTIVNAGTLYVRADSLGTGDITFAGNGALRPVYGAYPVLDNNLTVNSGVTAELQAVNQYYRITIAGAVAGSGTLIASSTSNGAGSVTLSNAANTFTGTLQVGTSTQGVNLTVNSLADGANPILMYGTSSRPAYFTLGSGEASSLLFDSRQITLLGGAGSVVKISNNNGTAGNTIIINTDLAVDAAGNKTLNLGGSNTGSNAFTGAISDGVDAVISLAKEGGGTWALSGTNSYSGTTTLNAGTLSIGASNNLGDGSDTNGLVFNGGTLRITGTELTHMWDLTNSGTRPITYTAGKAVGLDIADAGHTFTVDHVLNQTTGGLTKSGEGTLVLGDINTYTGNTAVTAGTLDVTGEIAGSAVTVNADAQITGGGTVKSLTINTGAGFTWGFGDGGDYTMDVDGDLSLADNWVIKLVDLGADPDASLTYDLFTYGGAYDDAAEFSDALTNLVIDDTEALGWDTSGLTIIAAGGYVSITGVGSTVTVGDANGDGVVDSADYIMVKTHLGGAPGAEGVGGDLDGDGTVDWDDLQILQTALTAGAGAGTPIPEPATMGLLAFGAFAMIRRRRRA